jgi:hypothetical protein
MLGMTCIATSISRDSIAVIACFILIHQTVATELELAPHIAPVARELIAIIALFSGIEHAITTILGQACSAAAVTRLSVAVVTYLTKCIVDLAVAAPLRLTLVVASITRLDIPVIANLSISYIDHSIAAPGAHTHIFLGRASSLRWTAPLAFACLRPPVVTR